MTERRDGQPGVQQRGTDGEPYGAGAEPVRPCFTRVIGADLEALVYRLQVPRMPARNADRASRGLAHDVQIQPRRRPGFHELCRHVPSVQGATVPSAGPEVISSTQPPMGPTARPVRIAPTDRRERSPRPDRHLLLEGLGAPGLVKDRDT